MPSRLPVLLQDDAPRRPLPTVDALDGLWRDVRARPLWAPPNHWRYLRLRWRTRLKLIDPRRVKLIAPAGKVNDCSACKDICCVGQRSTVQLRLRDIATLIDIGRTDLITTDKPSFSEAELDDRPALRRTVESQGWQLFPVLRQNAYHACAALSSDGLCTLYPNWPLSCARFPYALHADAREAFYSPRCDSYWVRPDARGSARRMVEAAVGSYNERIKDMVLLDYSRERLAELGILPFLNLPDSG